MCENPVNTARAMLSKTMMFPKNKPIIVTIKPIPMPISNSIPTATKSSTHRNSSFREAVSYCYYKNFNAPVYGKSTIFSMFMECLQVQSMPFLQFPKYHSCGIVNLQYQQHKCFLFRVLFVRTGSDCWSRYEAAL